MDSSDFVNFNISVGTYGRFAYKQPDNPTPNQTTCAVLHNNGNDQGFADEYCYSLFRYICLIGR